ncbi:DUF2071 domain-containing protein [Janthinobacterium psychrotolerans]|uniref:Uncharacterized protein n=1 Tax=Janthinobacterium psychrotolerans TaxID=1747903 RepID=A0A1A7C4W6_9BURK|nr:DUF2071 domain-containing protein [Janthinobacterium psychrotolerans]OBV40971.1 hypothetical protein ASR47_102214 [Janthinobacterium psychrotolerans]
MHLNTYLHPHPGRAGRLLARVANSGRWANWRHAVMSRLPFVTLASDVVDVIYVSWLVDAGAAQALLPPGLALLQRDGLTPFTVLTYRHGHFGPRMAGPLRRLMPSPLQSNWRLYLDQAPAGAPQVPTVFFLKNVMDSLPHALATRLFSDILPTHLAASMTHGADEKAAHCAILAGAGSAPAFKVQAQVAGTKDLDDTWRAMFGSWDNAVASLACQDAAVAHVPRNGRLALGEISLPVDLARVLPLTPQSADCALLAQLPPSSPPFAFLVPAVPFLALSEQLL